MNLQEYIVTVKSYDFLDQFYQDMESPGGNLYIPDRSVDLAYRRPLSRNTHYYLTDEEANQIINDPRVENVTLAAGLPGTIIEPAHLYTDPDNGFTKQLNSNPFHFNWGIYRCWLGQQVPGWGYIPGTTNWSTNAFYPTFEILNEGKDVDVVIVDGFIDPAHPEFAENQDGSGGSRVVQYDWNQHYQEVYGEPSPGPYVYGPYLDPARVANNNHGTHVAGTVSGNRQGWAKKSTIYNLYAYLSTSQSAFLIDFIRVFHKNKPVNPNTGIKKPTIVNMSFGLRNYTLPASITSLEYRGTTYTGPFTVAQLNSFGMGPLITSGTYSGYIQVQSRYTPIDSDIVDAQNEGVIFVGAAGNASVKIDVPNGLDYDNRFFIDNIFWYYNRGSSPASAPNVICVGAIDNYLDDRKATYSNCGPRVDLFAPGTAILSSWLNLTGGAVLDIKRQQYGNYYYNKIPGTSMASPQVAGVLACMLELYPRMTQSEARDYIINYAKTGQIYATNGGYTDYISLQGAANKFLAWVKERKEEGAVYPKNTNKSRPSKGLVFPRSSISRFGR